MADQSPNRFKCECGATFASKAELLDHEEAHGKGRTGTTAEDDLQDEDLTSGGEPGQTEEERREWKEVRSEEANDKTP